MFGNSIQNRLRISFIGLAALPLLLLGIVLVWRTVNTQEDQAISLQTEIAQRVSDQVDSFIQARQSELIATSQVRGLTSQEVNEQKLILSELLSYQRAFDELVLLDQTGQEIIYISRSEFISDNDFVSRVDKPEYVNAIGGTPYYSPALIDETTGQLTITIAIPIEDLRTGQISHILIGNIRLQAIQNILQDTGENTNVYILNADGLVIAHKDISVVLRGTEFNLPQDNGIHQGLDNNNVVLVRNEFAVGNQTLLTVVETPVGDALSLAIDTTTLIGVTILAALILAIIIGIVSVRFVVNPLQELATVATRIQEGDLSLQAEVKSQDEIGALATAFNGMTSQLRQMVEGLEKRVAERTRDLELAVDVSQQIADYLQVDELLNVLTQQVRQSFDLYAINVFLLDEEQDILVLRAGAGEYVSGKLPEFAVPMEGKKSLIARAGRTKNSVVVQDVSQDADYLVTTELPETRSELVLPLIRGQKLLGLIDLQSKETNRFGEDDIRVMETLARQVSVAIEHAQLFSEQLKIAEELRVLDKLKSQFLASMSHELRTPLNAIINFTQFVMNGVFGDVNEEQNETLDKVILSGRHLLSLINDILDYSKIEAGMLQLFMQDVDLSDVFEVVQTTVAGLEIPAGVEVKYDIAQDLPKTMRGDKRRIRQILINLMSNAIKFTQEGSVTLKAWLADGEINFSVTDTGVGISQEQLDTVFEPFQQAEEGQKKGKGTGLGLPISRHLAEAHGGKLWLESEANQGATFYVSLPLQKETQHVG